MRRQPRLSAYKIELTYRIPEKPGAVKRAAPGERENKMIYVLLAMLGVGCVYLALGMLVDRLTQPMERRGRR